MNKSPRRRIAFVTNFCPHYRVRTFEVFAQKHDVDYYFFSAGDDWYWQQQHGVRIGQFKYRYVPGFRIAGTRITPRLPIALWRERYDAYIKCVNGRFALPATYLAARLARRPFILWTGVWMRIDTPAHRLFYPITRYIYRHADAIVVYGKHVRRFLESEGVSTQKIFVAPHAIDNEQYGRSVTPDEILHLRNRLKLHSGQKVILFLGRLEEGKGLDFLIRAFTSLEDDGSVLVLAGDGSLRGALEQMVIELDIADRVRFAGYVESAATVAYYAMAEVYVLPSVTTQRFKEPWGLVVNEAFNQGVPVVATTAVGSAAGGLLKDGLNGFIVPERDPSALASAVQRLLEDEALRRTMSDCARITVQGWTNEKMVAGFEAAVEYVLNSIEKDT